MKVTEIFEKILETRRYCMNQRHGICDGCPYETEANCQTAIKADVEKVRDRLEAICNAK